MSRLRAASFLALFLALSTTALPLLADTPPATSKTSPEAADPGEVLDFLADWQGDDGQWVDPMTFDRIDPHKVASVKPAHHAKPPVAPPSPATTTPPQNDGKPTV